MFLFILIVKSDIKIFVWSVVKGRISISSVGATIGRPSSLRLQNAHPSVAKSNGFLSMPVGVGAHDDPRTYGSPSHIRLSSFLIVGTGVLDDPRSLRSQTKPLSVAEMLGLQKPSPVGEGGRHVIISSATPEKSIDNIPTKV